MRDRRLGTWLTEDDYPSFEGNWESQWQVREELKDKPDELRRYENKPHQATFNDIKAERFRKRGNLDKATELRNLYNTQIESRQRCVSSRVLAILYIL